MGSRDRHHRRRAVGVMLAGALVVGAVMAPVAAAAPTRRVTFSRTGSGWADVSLPKGAVLRREAVTVTTRGRYAALYVEPASGQRNIRPVLFAGRLPYLGSDGLERLALGPERTVVSRAGAYRFYLLSDGPTSITVRVSGLARDWVVRTSRPLAVNALTRDLAATAMALGHPMARNDARAELPFPASSRVVSLYAMSYLEPPTGLPWGKFAVCETARGATTCPDEPPTFGFEPQTLPDTAVLLYGVRSHQAGTALLSRYAGYSRPASLKVVMLSFALT